MKKTKSTFGKRGQKNWKKQPPSSGIGKKAEEQG